MLNRIIIMGRLTRDPELRHTQSGTAVASFSLAVDRDFKSQNGEKDWHIWATFSFSVIKDIRFSTLVWTDWEGSR